MIRATGFHIEEFWKKAIFDSVGLLRKKQKKDYKITDS